MNSIRRWAQTNHKTGTQTLTLTCAIIGTIFILAAQWLDRKDLFNEHSR